MHQVTFAPTYTAWSAAARRALQHQLPPGAIHWQELGDDQPPLALFDEAEGSGSIPDASATTRFRVPKAFPEISRAVACHRNSDRWALLYSILWRLTHGDPQLLQIVTDPEVAELFHMQKAIRHDIHKMRAFVRFREVPYDDVGSWFVAWFEPEHHIVELNSKFFVDRFASMRWSILGPDRCLHWDLQNLSLTEGVPKSEAPTEDRVEALWLNYYAHIFNPARVKTRAMQKEMPKRYWKNLPEAALIPALLQEAPRRVETMISQSEAKNIDELEWRPAQPPATRDLVELRTAAAACTACPLYKNATQTVFGEGPDGAEVVFLGEQPGDQEDRAGHPFVGPAGQLLDRALAEAGIDRSRCYVTNVVKHFKWEPRGKRRLHQTPNSHDVAACRPWMEAELAALKAKVVVCLGSTAAKALFGAAIRVTRDRGEFRETEWAAKTLVTVHPSSLLRAPTEEARAEGYQAFLSDLRVVAAAIA